MHVDTTEPPEPTEVPWTDELLSDTREVVLELLEAGKLDATPDFGQLARTVAAHRERLHRDARPLTDLDLADALAEATVGLLDRAAAEPAAIRRLASLPAKYFVHHQDDLASPFGFDDDLEVFNAVAARIAPELVLPG